MPGLPGEIGDLGREKAVAGRIEQVEILQGIGPDDALGRLDRAIRAGRHQLRRDLGGEDIGQHSRRLFADVAARRDETDQMLDQRLGDRGVRVVMRHVVADAVGAPAERQFRQIAGADHQPAIVVRQPEQVVGAQPGLDVLEGHVVERLALRRGVADIGKHLIGRRADVDLGAADPQRLDQPPGIGLGLIAGRKTGQRVG